MVARHPLATAKQPHNMKQTHTAILILALLATMASCQKDSDTVTLGASIDYTSGAPKLHLSGTTPQWESNDSVWINGNGNYTVTFNNNGTTAQITNVARDNNNEYTAVYPANIVTGYTGRTVNITLPREQEYVSGTNGQQIRLPLIAYNNGNNLTFKSLCSLVKISINTTGNSLSISRITLTASSAKLSGPTTASIQNGQSLLGTMDDEAEHDVSLVFSTPEEINSTPSDYYIAVPEFPNNDEVSIIIHTSDGKFFPLIKSNVSLLHNSIASLSITVGQLQTPHHAFSIDGSRKVRFSKGNLQYTTHGTHNVAGGGTAAGTWRFAKHQYDTIGAKNSNISDPNYTDTGWIDLFGWATSGYNYSPTLDSTSSTSYLNKKMDIAQTYYDWGKYNQIEDYLINTWRTLTYNEWDYILDSRTGTTINSVSGIKYAEVSVNNTRGLLIFPDNFDWPSAVSNQIITYNNYHNNWNNVNYSIAQWSILDASGAIFLPAAGKRDGTNITDTNQAGYYWTSSNAPSIGGDPKNEARCLYFINNAVFRGNFYRNRYLGFSVRLAQDTQ